MSHKKIYKILTTAGELLVVDEVLMKMTKEYMGEREFAAQTRVILRVE